MYGLPLNGLVSDKDILRNIKTAAGVFIGIMAMKFMHTSLKTSLSFVFHSIVALQYLIYVNVNLCLTFFSFFSPFSANYRIY